MPVAILDTKFETRLRFRLVDCLMPSVGEAVTMFVETKKVDGPIAFDELEDLRIRYWESPDFTGMHFAPKVSGSSGRAPNSCAQFHSATHWNM
jgi:hypothetical protein